MPEKPDKQPEQATRTLWGYLDFVTKVRTIAALREMTIPQVLQKYAGPAIDRECARCVKEKHVELGSGD